MQSFQQQQRLNMINEQLQNVAYPETTFGLTENNNRQHVAFPQRQQQGLWKQLDGRVYGQEQQQIEVIDNVLRKTLKNIQHQQHHQLQLQQQELLEQQTTMMIQNGVVAQKCFRIISEEVFVNPKSISVCVNGRLCQVTGLCKSGRFELVQFKKTYQLPSYVIPSKNTIFFTEHGKFIIEFPIVQGFNGQQQELESTVEYVRGGQQQFEGLQQLGGLQQHQQSEIVDITVQGMIARQQQPITTLPGLRLQKLSTEEEYFPVSHLNWGPVPESKYMWEQKQQQILTPTNMTYKTYGF